MMIYNVGGTSQNRLSARVYTLTQRGHIITLVDRAMQEDGIPFIRAAENLQVRLVLTLFAGGVLLFRIFKKPQIIKVAIL
jgi:hypothetical protein